MPKPTVTYGDWECDNCGKETTPIKGANRPAEWGTIVLRNKNKVARYEFCEDCLKVTLPGKILKDAEKITGYEWLG